MNKISIAPTHRIATYIARATDSNALEPLIYAVEILEDRGDHALIRYLEPPYQGRTALVEARRIQQEGYDEPLPY